MNSNYYGNYNTNSGFNDNDAQLRAANNLIRALTSPQSSGASIISPLPYTSSYTSSISPRSIGSTDSGCSNCSITNNVGEYRIYNNMKFQ